MRIVLVADPMIAVPPKHYGGIERIIDMLCREYVRLGHEVVLIARPDSSTAGKLIPLPGLRYDSPLDMIKNAWAISKLAWDFNPDVVHSFGRLVQLMPLLPTRFTKVMSYQREPGLKGIARANCLARRGTLLFTGCSDYISRQISSVGTARTIYNGVPLDRYQFRDEVASDAPLVFLGRIEKIKGPHNAIEIAKRAGKRLIIAGNVPDGQQHREYFELQIRPQLCESIEYIGPVDDQQKNVLLGKALALVMAIEWNEPFGIVMAEALACGTPVIGTPHGAVPEVVIDGKTGFVRQSIDQLITCVNELPAISRLHCRQHCDQYFSDQSVVSSYLSAYQSTKERECSHL